MQAADFGEHFTWGVASAAFQIEGAWNADGKAPSVWDEVARRGRMAGGRVSDDAIDFYHRYADDIALIATLGFTANRLSLSWPRILGAGAGPPNQAGIDFYNRVIDCCLEHGLQPWVTLFHWDLPLELHRRGGFANRAIVDLFADYASVCARAFGDRVKHWMVFNEPNSVAGHLLIGVHDRWGLHLGKTLRSVHHMNLAIAAAARRLRHDLPSGARLGTTLATMPMHPFDPTDGWRRRAHAAYDALFHRIFADPLGGLGYPWEATPLLRWLRPAIAEGDDDRLPFRFDFLGVQYYAPIHIRRAPIPGLWGVPSFWMKDAKPVVRCEVGWFAHPPGFMRVLQRYATHPIADRLVVTENGIGVHDDLQDGRVHDEIRIWYYRTHLEVVRAAIRQGLPVDGYFCWSYADNIEWLLGRRPRLGLVYIDYENGLRRYPKDSALWFRDLLSPRHRDAGGT
jgi:beta-glucosidase